ncbi:MAG: bifunctional precorrin-2 dehydrogenase/sirohydrochlorin ferrochelatase, partial [Deltaproteobacteria bacterium]
MTDTNNSNNKLPIKSLTHLKCVQQSKKYYPILIDLEGRRCVVIGGGVVASRKVKSLLDAGAEVLVVSNNACRAIKNYHLKNLIEYIEDDYRAEFLKGAVLVIGATDNENINQRVARDAKKRSVLVNIVDAPQYCDFIVPATVQRGDLTIAISTGGASPALAKKIRKELETVYGKEYVTIITIMKKIRKTILARGGNSNA